jgi:hypothetical protein
MIKKSFLLQSQSHLPGQVGSFIVKKRELKILAPGRFKIFSGLTIQQRKSEAWVTPDGSQGRWGNPSFYE